MELTTLSQLLLVSLLAVPLLYLLWSKAARRRPSGAAAPPPPPGPTPFPVIGNIPDLLRHGGELHRALAGFAASYGPVMSLRLGMATTVVLSSPDAAHEALHKRDGAISSRWVPDNANVLGHQDISMAWLPSSSPLWKHMRTLASTLLFTSRRLGASRGIRERKARELVDHLGARSGRPVRVGLAVFGSVLNFMSNVFFSEDVVELGSETGQAFQQLIADSVAETAKPNISDFFPFLSALDLSRRRRAAARNLKRFYDFFDDVIDRRLNSGGEKPGDLLDSLLELHAKSQLERPLIRALMTDLFIAGSHTTTTTLEWAMAELLRNPGKMARARAELREAFGQGAVEEGELAGLPYLQAVIKETLRLHPPAPLLLPHRVSEPGVTLGGFSVPEGTRVLINAWAIGRDPAAWPSPEPEAFAPERFLDREADFWGRTLEFIPFGSGRRACPGIPLAVAVVPMVLAAMLHSLEWRLPEGMAPGDVDVGDRFGAALELATPLWAVPVQL
ncbi:cytochrome P450 76M5-like [Oryza brachyantha]|uniref:cytochrome P450 76M5-like n=1 Tax=Oryza brachyantha TaxID=4533 RepID=UPI001AD98ADE|nr:cytochrome P450 76M5-like [Oryza brachyantha]